MNPSKRASYGKEKVGALEKRSVIPGVENKERVLYNGGEVKNAKKRKRAENMQL